jgi:hypothetical protein
MVLTLIFFFDGILSDILSDKEPLVIILGWWLLVLSTVSFHLQLLLLRKETHLLMVWRGEHIFVLGLSGQLWRKDLTLNVTIGSNVRDWKSYTLMHHLSI